MIALRRALATEQAARDVETYAAWGEKLTLQQYLDREARLRAHPWPRHALRTWLLVEGTQTLASCETYAMDAWKQPRGGRLRVEGIASVYVEAALRGQGHATALMHALAERMRDEGAGALILFSDVGPALYARSGFVARPALERQIAPEPGDAANVCDRLVAAQALADALTAAPRPDDGLLIWPSAAQLSWHLEREAIYAEVLKRARPAACGAIAGATRAFWMADFKSNVLRILLLASSRTDEALAVLQAAARTASACGLERVVLWECAWPFALPDGGFGGTPLRRTVDSIPMILPLQPTIAPADWGHTARALWI